MLTDESSVRIDVSRAAITSSINRARTPQSLVRALAVEAVSHLLAFDYCSLVLPESDGQGIRIWRATISDDDGLVDDRFNRSDALLARVMGEGASRLILESDLLESSKEFGQDVKSALALPLSVGGNCFGLLCFASTQVDAYTKEDTERLMWLGGGGCAPPPEIFFRAPFGIFHERRC